MTLATPRSWRLAVAVVVLLIAGLQVARAVLLPVTHERLAQRYRKQIAAFDDEQATRLIEQLAADDNQWLEILVNATADSRPLVAQTAERELRNLVHRWAEQPAAESSPRAANLGRVLVPFARDLAPDQRLFVNSLSRELITWPIDGRAVDASGFIADCETVLLLPVAEPVEVRVALVEPLPQQEIKQEQSTIELPSELVSEAPAQILSADPSPAPLLAPEPVLQPAITPQAPNQPGRNEPGRFVPGKSNRISDD